MSDYGAEWHETAPGLLYEAQGDSGRRYDAAFDGERWTLDLFQDSEYSREQLVDRRPSTTRNGGSGMGPAVVTGRGSSGD